MSGPYLYLYRGLPGSGKSTAAAQHRNRCQRGVHLEADMFFVEKGEYKFDPTLLHRAHRWCQDSARIFLSNGYSVLVSNTATRYEECKEYANIANALGAPFVLIDVNTAYGSIHDVPQEAMNRMRDRWVTGHAVRMWLATDFPQLQVRVGAINPIDPLC